MTSIIGMKIQQTNEVSYIILGADTQVNIYKEKKLVEKRHGCKIWYGDWGAIAHSGGGEEIIEFKELEQIFKDGADKNSREKISAMLKKALTQNKNGERYFEEINNLNRKLRRQGESYNDLYEFILATPGTEPTLWYIDEFGNVLDYKETCKTFNLNIDSRLEYICIGSGSKKLERFVDRTLNDTKKFDPRRTTPMETLKFVHSALAYAEIDTWTSGFDPVSITSKLVKYHGERIRERQKKGVAEEIESIGKEIEGELSIKIEDKLKTQ